MFSLVKLKLAGPISIPTSSKSSVPTNWTVTSKGFIISSYTLQVLLFWTLKGSGS